MSTSGSKSSKKSGKKKVSANDERFISSVHAEYYSKLKDQNITESKYLDQPALKHDITALFENSSLLPLISMCFAYSKEMLYVFFANLEISSSRHLLTSRVDNMDVEFSREDFHRILKLSMEGPSPYWMSRNMNWKDVNLRLRAIPFKKHMGDTASLHEEPHVIQHVLRSCVIPKIGERESISPVSSLTTYYILTNTQFDAVDLVVGYIEKILSVRRSDSKLSRNLALGGPIAYMIFQKYSLLSAGPLDGIATAFSNKNFNALWPSSESRNRKARRESRDLARRAAAAAGSSSGEEYDDDDEDDDSGGAPPSRGYSPSGASTSTAPTELGALASEMSLLRTAVCDGFSEVRTRMDQVDLRFDRIETRVDGLYDIFGQRVFPPPGGQ